MDSQTAMKALLLPLHTYLALVNMTYTPQVELSQECVLTLGLVVLLLPALLTSSDKIPQEEAPPLKYSDVSEAMGILHPSWRSRPEAARSLAQASPRKDPWASNNRAD
jgi:hypothetical protein